MPAVVSAAANVDELFADIQGWITRLIPLMFAIGLVVFLYGLVRFLFSNNSDDATENGKRIMIWGIIALFVMASVWGLVNFLQGSFGLNTDDKKTIKLPQVPS